MNTLRHGRKAWLRRGLAALILVGLTAPDLAFSQAEPAKGQAAEPAPGQDRPAAETPGPPQPSPPKAQPAQASPKPKPRKETEAEKKEREQLNKRLLDTAAQIQKSEGELTALEARLSALEAEEQDKRGSLDKRRAENTKILSALLRMGRNPPPVMITQREDALAVVRSAMLLASAFPLLSRKATELADELTKLATVMTEVKGQRDSVKRDTDRLKADQTRLAGLLAEKQKALKAWQPELAAVGAEVAALAKSTDSPDQLIVQGDKIVSGRTGLGAYQSETKDPSAEKTDVVILAPSGPGQVPGGASRMQPSIAFVEAKARLPLPAQGRRVINFGDKTHYGGQSKGIVLETRAGAQITSPCDGWIVYSSEFRSYGQLLIINAGDGYHVLLAGLSQVDVKPGQFVLAAEPVGTMSPAPAQGAAKGSAPVLYIEFRKDNRPVDPDPWWVKKVQE